MAKGEVSIELDREDGIFLAGEEISGVVIVEAASAFACNGVFLEHKWHTHAFSEIHQGDKVIITLSPATTLQSAERREYVFSFKAPSEPVTYHGKKLNVDWQLKAWLEIPEDSDLEFQIDFVLVSDVAKQVPTGDLGIHGEQGKMGPELTRFAIAKIILLLLAAIGLIIFAFIDNLRYFLCLFPSVITFFIFLWFQKHVFILIAKRRLRDISVEIEPDVVRVGDKLLLKVRFAPKKNGLYLEIISGWLQATERIEGSDDEPPSDSFFYVYRYYREKTYRRYIYYGQNISIEIPFRIPLNAPPSFSAPSTRLKWTLACNINMRHWPDWEKTFPIKVIP